MGDDLPSSSTNFSLFLTFLSHFSELELKKAEKLGRAYLFLYFQLLPSQLLLLNSCLEACFSHRGLLISQMNNVPLHLPSSWRPADMQARCWQLLGKHLACRQLQKAKVTLSRRGWGASPRLNHSLAPFTSAVILSDKKCAARAWSTH